MNLTPKQISYAIKPAVFFASLLPLAWYAWALVSDQLGANPIESITRGSGDWALRFLLITLAVTPIRKLLKWNWVIRLRRMLGLFAFFYAAIHLMTYLWLDQFFSWPDIWLDIVDRPFITVGFASFVILSALAITSPKYMLRKMGKWWSKLHKTVYAASVLSILHFWWMKASKSDISEPLLYSIILVLLLAVRIPGIAKAISLPRQPAKSVG